MTSTIIQRKSNKSNANSPITTQSENVVEKSSNGKFDICFRIVGGIAFLSFVIVVVTLCYLILLQGKEIETPIPKKKKLFEEDTSKHFVKDIGFEYPFIIGEVKRIQVSAGEEFANKIAAAEEPIILTNTSVDKWPARRLWNPDYVVKYTNQFDNCQKHPNKTFLYYHGAKPMAPFDLEYKKNHTWEKVNMTSLEFFQKVTKPPPYYYYADMGEFFETDVEPREQFIVKDDYYNPSTAHKNKWTNVWLGAGGATTQAHYDVYYNFYAQVYGRKRFILFPPEEHENLYIFPFLHPAALQSQVDFDSPDYKKFPNFKKAKALQAVLTPGDVLFIPPLYFHHVTAIDTSMSVSMWTKFPEAKAIQSTWSSSSELPFLSSWPNNVLQYATRYFLEKLIDSIYQTGSAKQFISRLWDERYKPLIERVPNLLLHNESYCADDLLSISEQEKFKNEVEEAKLFSAKIKEYTEIFNKVPNASRKELWLGHLCEQITWTVFGTQNVARLLKDFVDC